MKTICKQLAALSIVLLLCIGTIPLSVCAVSSLNAGGLLMIDQNRQSLRDAALVSLGGQTVTFIFGDYADASSIEFIPAAGDDDLECSIVQMDTNAFYTILRVKNTSGVPVLTMQDAPMSGSLYVLYYDLDTKSMATESVRITKCQNNVLTLSDVAVNVTEGAALLDSNYRFVGILAKDSSNVFYGLTTEYILTHMTDEIGNEESVDDEEDEAEAVDEDEAEDDADETYNDFGSSASDHLNASTILFTILLAVVVGGLIFLLIRAKTKKNTTPEPVVNGMYPGNVPNDPQGSIPHHMPAGTPAFDPMVTMDLANSAYPAAVGSSERICVLGHSGLFDGRRFEANDILTFGRQADRCNVCYPVDAKGVSGIHCQLRKTGEQIELVDLGSTYGTFLNGAQIPAHIPVPVHEGDRFYLAHPINTFVIWL